VDSTGIKVSNRGIKKNGIAQREKALSSSILQLIPEQARYYP
jgi:hypothetical protein